MLSGRIIEISETLLELKTDNLNTLFFFDLLEVERIHASMTMFYLVSHNIIFINVLNKYFNGEYHKDTVERLKELDEAAGL